MKEEVRAGRGWGQVMRGLVGHRGDLGFYPKGGRRPGGLWAKQEWDLGDMFKSSRSRSWGPGRWLFPYL